MAVVEGAEATDESLEVPVHGEVSGVRSGYTGGVRRDDGGGLLAASREGTRDEQGDLRAA